MLLKVANKLLPLLRKNNNIKLFSAFSTTYQEEKIKIKNWNINYLKVGNGAHHVIFIPGAIGSIWTDFRPQVEGFNRDKFTVVAFDPPGYGKSRPPERDFPLDFYERDADYACELMKALKIPKFSVVGWSDGATVGMILAAKYADAVNKLVVFGGNSFILPHDIEMVRKVRDVKTWSPRMRQPMVNLYGEDLFPRYWEAWVDGYEALAHAKGGDICDARLKDIRCPTFILYGQKDPMVASVHASHLHTHIVGSRLHLYPDGKHNIHIAYAEDFNKRVQEFLLLP